MHRTNRSLPLGPPAAVGWSLGLHAAALGVAAATWWWLVGSGSAVEEARAWRAVKPAQRVATWAVMDPEPEAQVSGPAALPEPGLTETESTGTAPAPVLEVLAVLPLDAPVPDAAALVGPRPPASTPPPAAPVTSTPAPVAPVAPSRARPPVPDPAFCPPPAYPVPAVRRALEGRVLLIVRVDRNGMPLSVQIAESSGHDMLDQAARTVVEGWRYRPAWNSDGEPCSGTVYVPVRFSLER